MAVNYFLNRILGQIIFMERKKHDIYKNDQKSTSSINSKYNFTNGYRRDTKWSLIHVKHAIILTLDTMYLCLQELVQNVGSELASLDSEFTSLDPIGRDESMLRGQQRENDVIISRILWWKKNIENSLSNILYEIFQIYSVLL